MLKFRSHKFFLKVQVQRTKEVKKLRQRLPPVSLQQFCLKIQLDSDNIPRPLTKSVNCHYDITSVSCVCLHFC